MIEPLGPSVADDARALVDAAMPGERLSTDDLLGVCWDDSAPSIVLGLRDLVGMVAAVVRNGVGTVTLLAVHPDSRRMGHGRALLDAATAWAFDEGAEQVTIGASPPYYLWPGIDVIWTPGLVLAESAGFRPRDVAINLSCPTSVRIPAPEGVTVRRVMDDHDAIAVIELCRRAFAESTGWAAEAARGIEHGACHAAFDEDGTLLGFAAHSVNRAGWFGPTGVDPARQRRGVGGPLLAACLEDLMVAGFEQCEVAWIGPVGFYAKAAGAEVSRVFRIVAKRR